MSLQDNGPAEDTARKVFPVTFFGDDLQGMTDFRPHALPASAPEEETGPKAESAPAPASSSGSTTTPVETAPESPAQKPAVKAPGPNKPGAPGKQTS